MMWLENIYTISHLGYIATSYDVREWGQLDFTAMSELHAQGQS